jgi:proton-translocating NAD(P)+ transhydrogenase subunit alpha
MKLAIPAESSNHESRVAATPETVAAYIKLGFKVFVQVGAGDGSRFPDQQYKDAGATLCKTADATVKDADVVLRVLRPTSTEVAKYKKNALVIGIMEPSDNRAGIDAIAKSGVAAFAMEYMPRITRAQVMDVLSSQANLAGYQSVIDAASEFDRAMPMMMTAAGTISPARVFVMGAGVAGLQAIATARRLGAAVSATDVRPAAKEQVESLAAKFIAVEDDEFKQAETAGGYAKEMSKDYQAKQAKLTASHIAKQDIVITTALIPGRPAPVLVTKEMVESMKPGSIIVDLAVERGGNCPLSKLGKVVTHNNVKIVGYANVPGRVAASSSSLYARNLKAFVETLVDQEKAALKVDWDDEIIKATLLTKGGKVVHQNLVTQKAGAKPKTTTKRKAAAKSEAKPKAKGDKS